MKTKRVYGANICFDCKNACGNCEWSKVDPETGKIRFHPVPGWTAKKVKLRTAWSGEIDTYRITSCPKFDPIAGAKYCKQKNAKIPHDHHKHPVIATLPDGSELSFPSISEAARSTRANVEGIRIACKNGKSKSGGYRWRYDDAKQRPSRHPRVKNRG